MKHYTKTLPENWFQPSLLPFDAGAGFARLAIFGLEGILKNAFNIVFLKTGSVAGGFVARSQKPEPRTLAHDQPVIGSSDLLPGEGPDFAGKPVAKIKILIAEVQRLQVAGGKLIEVAGLLLDPGQHRALVALDIAVLERVDLLTKAGKKFIDLFPQHLGPDLGGLHVVERPRNPLHGKD